MEAEAAFTQLDAHRIPFAAYLPAPALHAASGPGNDYLKRAVWRGVEHVLLSLGGGCFKPAWQPIADTGLGDEKARMIRVGFDLLPQLAHEDAQVLNVVALIASPDLLEQLVVRDDEADMHRQDMEQAILLAPQPDGNLVEGDLASDEVDRERAGDDDGIFRRGLEVAPQRRFAARQELGHAERLDQITVRARLQQPNLLVFGGDHGENDHRNIRPRADALQHLNSMQIR